MPWRPCRTAGACRRDLTTQAQKCSFRYGSGIEKNDLPRIYDPYFTSKPAGTGLGLAVVQKIMEAHGAFLNIESQAGAGTKVTLRFAVS
jgi:signal transduction histidine kinase